MVGQTDHWLSDARNVLVLRFASPAWSGAAMNRDPVTEAPDEQMRRWTAAAVSVFLKANDLEGVASGSPCEPNGSIQCCGGRCGRMGAEEEAATPCEYIRCIASNGVGRSQMQLPLQNCCDLPVISLSHPRLGRSQKYDSSNKTGVISLCDLSSLPCLGGSPHPIAPLHRV